MHCGFHAVGTRSSHQPANIAMAAMDTDEQHNQTASPTNLRRSNSAPLINGANLSETSLFFLPALTPRQRRSSTSQMANGVPVVSIYFIY